MLRTPRYILEDVHEVKRLIRDYPWATIVSHTHRGLAASHYPVLLDEDVPADQIVLVGHVGRPDEITLGLDQGTEILVIVQGAHGYVSPSWYPAGEFIPTWDHATAHLWGRPEVLSDEENFHVLTRLVDVFEAPLPHPRSLENDESAARRAARGTAGFRIRVTRFDARRKYSQNKPRAVVDDVIRGLEGDGPYAQPHLASEMRRYYGQRESGHGSA